MGGYDLSLKHWLFFTVIVYIKNEQDPFRFEKQVKFTNKETNSSMLRGSWWLDTPPEFFMGQSKSKLSRKQAHAQPKVKILMLGIGGSGKSTIIKQLRLKHKGFGSIRRVFLPIVLSNTLESIQSILRAMSSMNLSVASELQHIVTEVVNTGISEDSNIELFQNIALLWRDDNVKLCFSQSNKYQLLDSAEYFLDNCLTFVSPNYVPTDLDILRCRTKTTGINEIEFSLDGREFLVVDVGGQRSERKKWLHCFEGVDAVFYVVGSSEYDQLLSEDDETNRMEESLKLFRQLEAHPFLSRSRFVLFMNKKDIFSRKITQNPLSNYFADYKGTIILQGTTMEEGLEFLKGKFLEDIERPIDCVYTNGIDAQNLDDVIASITKTIS